MILLASASPRRRELLTQAGIRFTVEPAEIDETPLPNEPAAAYVQRVATEKAQAVSALHSHRHTPADPLIVLAADTAVVLQATPNHPRQTERRRTTPPACSPSSPAAPTPS